MQDLDASNRALWAEVKAVRAENDRLRAELAAIVKTADVAMNQAVSWEENARRNYSRAERAEAAIARVRDMCEANIGLDRQFSILPTEVMRALDGVE